MFLKDRKEPLTSSAADLSQSGSGVDPGRFLPLKERQHFSKLTVTFADGARC